MFCHHCGTQTGEGVQFCPNCGQSLGPGAALSAPRAVAWTAPTGIHSRTGHWIGAGWDLVKQDFGTYFLLALTFSVLNSLVPVILTGPLMAGFHIFCMKKMLGRRAEFADLFTGFNFFIPALVASLVITVFTLAGTLLCLIPAVTGRVPLSMRGAFSHVQVRRSGPVRERYPMFLYDLFGNKAVKMPDICGQQKPNPSGDPNDRTNW